ncbi:addiction module protein [Nevskia sp.]|uniref:addiction module protein n=1 Tax=Nevskia sp. TaxID=1929292 RepID=UPI0025E403B1|nr:addiction module protein [Nevskia sp.]
MNTETLTEAVLHLPRAERASLAQRLLDSLDDVDESVISVDWLDLATQRAAEIDAGKVRLVTPEELEVQVQALLK